MKLTANLSASFMLMALSACTTPEIKKDQTPPVDALKQTAPVESESSVSQDETPPLTHSKGGKTLRLVRMMDGGACKNDQEGLKGIFLLYADPDDIERIKSDQGAQVFNEFERRIEAISSVALQQAVNKTVFTLDPFALGVTDAQIKVARQLLQQFDLVIAPAVDEFQQETTLTIDISPFFSSLVFYSEGCDATHQHQDGSD